MEEGKIRKYIEEPLQKAIEIYTQNPQLRNSISQMPMGIALDQFIVGLGRDFQQKRLVQAIQLLHQEMSLIDESKIDKQFLQTEEFIDLIVKAIENSVKTRHKDRVLLNCKILSGSILIENKEIRHSAEDLLVLISDLTPIDLKVAKEIYKQQKDKPEKFDMEEDKNNALFFVRNAGWDNLRQICELDESDFLLSLHKLSNAHLVEQVVGSYIGYMGDKYIITSTFQRLMSIISYSKEPIFIYGLD